MARLKFNFRAVLKEIAQGVQQRNLERLLVGERAGGGNIAPLRQSTLIRKSGKGVRARVLGQRATFAQRPGVATGFMMREMTRAGTIRIRKYSFKIIPRAEVMPRWFVFNAGRPGQVARPISGMTPTQMEDAAKKIAKSGLVQITKALNKRGLLESPDGES